MLQGCLGCLGIIFLCILGWMLINLLFFGMLL